MNIMAYPTRYCICGLAFGLNLQSFYINQYWTKFGNYQMKSTHLNYSSNLCTLGTLNLEGKVMPADVLLCDSL